MNRFIGGIILTVLLAIGAGLADAEDARKLPRIGQIFGANPVIAKPFDEAFRQGLRSLGYVDGKNVTGGSVLGPETASKRLELAMEMLPGLRRAGLMYEASAYQTTAANKFRTFAQGVGVTLHLVGVRSLDEIETALKAMQRNRLQALFLWSTFLMYEHGFRVIAESASYKVPVITDGRVFAEAGALLTYNANYHEMYRRGALYVDKILKGAKPGDLPIEQPTKFELIVNLKTAKALGIKVPESILPRADEIIR